MIRGRVVRAFSWGAAAPPDAI
ncbi:hypothetical protein KL86PLE_40446 [uncultured Pleomorphomonas sp.]|uniref:Uncharacterized protein n=1 Tax=uncultured Pleomorphomonas sp. TaxID=442121 RepID=A0A212LGF1_9HYPH|nr:hypothetical protein KL86PLE_40446 [uncultured Pleomorphomonas sp.]